MLKQNLEKSGALVPWIRLASWGMQSAQASGGGTCILTIGSWACGGSQHAGLSIAWEQVRNADSLAPTPGLQSQKSRFGA